MHKMESCFFFFFFLFTCFSTSPPSPPPLYATSTSKAIFFQHSCLCHLTARWDQGSPIELSQHLQSRPTKPKLFWGLLGKHTTQQFLHFLVPQPMLFILARSGWDKFGGKFQLGLLENTSSAVLSTEALHLLCWEVCIAKGFNATFEW